MLKIGTVFSGIGAFEHALKRMNIEHQIVFACDNGDVDILSKKIPVDIESIDNNFLTLEEQLDSLEVESSLAESMDEIKNRLFQLKESFENYKNANTIDLDDKKTIKSIRDFAERLSMIFEMYETLKIHNKLKNIPEYSEKKKFIDDLYNSKKEQNKVRKSYFANYDISEDRFHWNVSFLDGNQYRDSIDIFVGGSPCQSFSLVGKQRGLEDTRGTLFYEYARLVNEIKPKIFIYENVKAVLSNDEGRTWETMKKVFTELGYTWAYSVLNAKDYGIPQNRERIFVIGFRNDLGITDIRNFPPQKIELTKKCRIFCLIMYQGNIIFLRKVLHLLQAKRILPKNTLR